MVDITAHILTLLTNGRKGQPCFDCHYLFPSLNSVCHMVGIHSSIIYSLNKWEEEAWAKKIIIITPTFLFGQSNFSDDSYHAKKKIYLAEWEQSLQIKTDELCVKHLRLFKQSSDNPPCSPNKN